MSRLTTLCTLPLLALAAKGFGAAPLAVLLDEVRVQQDAGSDGAVILLHGPSESSDCEEGELRTGAGVVEVGNLLPSDSECVSEVAVFSLDDRMMLDISPGWTSEPDEQRSISLGTPLQIKVNVWIVSDDARSEGWASDDILTATTMFNQANRVGVTFQEASVRRIPETGDQRAQTIGDGCESAPAVRDAGGTLYRSSQLNVYYIPVIDNSETRGIFCSGVEGIPNVIYISTNESSATTLAHEFGHALAVSHTGGEGWAMNGFGAKNLMWDSETWTESGNRDHFSLGQAYRMNVLPKSWVNRAGSGGSGLSLRGNAPKKDCKQDLQEDWPCPRLALDWP